jgi:hypothetical protein
MSTERRGVSVPNGEAPRCEHASDKDQCCYELLMNLHKPPEHVTSDLNFRLQPHARQQLDAVTANAHALAKSDEFINTCSAEYVMDDDGSVSIATPAADKAIAKQADIEKGKNVLKRYMEVLLRPGAFKSTAQCAPARIVLC